MGNDNSKSKKDGVWNGNEMSQLEFMEKDSCIVLNEEDEIIGSASKKEAHVFNSEQPRGILHRAFSVFLFDLQTNKLLLQQRASSKITFPNVWTNTCCSHPLHGMEPHSEVDSPQDVAEGKVPGVKYAAIRKLHHELGIPPTQLDVKRFKFLTRLHYWAADTVTHGPESPWGEHEIDYVLFYTIPNQSVLTLKPHPDEVRDIKWVNPEELQIMLDDPKLLFSPWCRLILKRWMNNWWKDLNLTMTTDTFVDYKTITRFDPPPEHFGGAGKAGPQFTTIAEEPVSDDKQVGDDNEKRVGDVTKKQGAYGKIKTHSESKLTQLLRFDEVWSALVLLYIRPLKSNMDVSNQNSFPPEELQFCDFILGKVSRSFAAVIRQLPASLYVDVMIFYLVLRALDTLEDDTTAFASVKDKIDALEYFQKNALRLPDYTKDGVGEGLERRLLQEFSKCTAVYKAISSESQDVIQDIATRMAKGMAEFVEKDMGQGTTTVEQYNLYCHYVAGLVGEGLSRLFAASKLEDPSVFLHKNTLNLANSMGLFLQKVNIIRDYLEDYVDGRAWWPQSVWKKYIPQDEEKKDLGYFAQNPLAPESLFCLHELITDVLELAPDCLEYMSKLKCREIFQFCAIPQVMAIATLEKLYDNPLVFTGVVKIRKGLSCKLILQTTCLEELHGIFHEFATQIAAKAIRRRSSSTKDPSYERTLKACAAIVALTEKSASLQQQTKWNSTMATSLLLMGIVGMTMFHGIIYAHNKQDEEDEFVTAFSQSANHVVRGIMILLMVAAVVLQGNNFLFGKRTKTLKTAQEMKQSKKQD